MPKPKTKCRTKWCRKTRVSPAGHCGAHFAQHMAKSRRARAAKTVPAKAPDGTPLSINMRLREAKEAPEGLGANRLPALGADNAGLTTEINLGTFTPGPGLAFRPKPSLILVPSMERDSLREAASKLPGPAFDRFLLHLARAQREALDAYIEAAEALAKE